MHFVALILGYLVVTLIVIALISMGVVLVLDIIYKIKHKKRLADQSRTEESLYHGLELRPWNSNSLEHMKGRLELFYNSESDTLTRRTIHRIIDAIDLEIQTKGSPFIHSRISQYTQKSFLPFLFIPTLDSVAQGVGYLLFALIVTAIVGIAIAIACESFSNWKYKKYLQKYYARRINIIKDWELDTTSDEELLNFLDQMSDTVSRCGEGDKMKPIFVEVTDAIRAEISKRGILV